MLLTIHNDHRNISLLLKVINSKIQRLEDDKEIDFNLVKVIVGYLLNYSSKYHHPMEDLIYSYCVDNGIIFDCIGYDLLAHHKQIKAATLALDETLDMILLDTVVPKELCIDKLKNFVKLQSEHINYEEQDILPSIQKFLLKEDWSKIEKKWLQEAYSDPLFGSDVTEQYKKLAAVIAKA